MLKLSRDKYIALIKLYPEMHEVILTNVIEMYGLNRLGEAAVNFSPSFLREEDQVQLPRIRNLVQVRK